MNEIFGALIVAASIQEMNKTLQLKGFNDYKDLISAIRQLDIEIAKAKDEGRPCDEKIKLRNDYYKLQKQYEEAEQRQKNKEKTAVTIAVIVLVGFFIILAVVLAITLS